MAARKSPAEGRKGDKIWRDAIHRAVKRAHEGGDKKRLEVLADQLVKEGIAGNVPALKEIGDRLDGKAVQPIAGADGEGPVIIERIERVVVDPTDTNS